MILADVYDLLNDVFVQVLKFVLLAAVIVLAVYIGTTLRKKHDAKVAAAEAAEAAKVSNSEDTTV